MASAPSIKTVHDAIDRWFAERIQRSIIAHQVNCYNAAHHARNDLKDRMAALFGDTPAESGTASESAPETSPETAPEPAKKTKTRKA